jgi:CO/xanthine dehydrogenase Mo-binding subunit
LDYVAEAAMAAKAWGKADPVKLVWQREDDMRAGYYRPLYVHHVIASLDSAGNLVAWAASHRRGVNSDRNALRKGAGKKRD